MCCTWYWNRK